MTLAADGPDLLLCYHLHGDLRRLRLPPPTAPGPLDGLWRHTCFEAFVARHGAAAYREFNFSPSGQWAAYRFIDQRVRDSRAPANQAVPPPVLRTQRSADHLSLLARLPGPVCTEGDPSQPLLIGLSAVIETDNGQLSYWALQHPAEQPDFHHRSGFAAVSDLLPLHPASATQKPP